MGTLLQRRAVAVLVIDEESVRGGGSPPGPDEPEDLDTVGVLVSVRVREGAVLALPGGKVDSGDSSLHHAAARELEEETGLGFPTGAFTVECTLNQPDWIVTLLSIRCPAAKKREVRNLEPDKHGPWVWRTWGDLRREPADNVFPTLGRMLQDHKSIQALGASER